MRKLHTGLVPSGRLATLEFVAMGTVIPTNTTTLQPPGCIAGRRSWIRTTGGASLTLFSTLFAMRRSWIRIPSRPPDSQKTERRRFFEEWSAVWSSKQFFHRAHREKEPPLNPWKFEKPILLVERQSVRVFGINDDASGSHFPAVQHGSVERIH